MSGTPFPPPERLGPDGVEVTWAVGGLPVPGALRPNARFGGEPARLTVSSESTRRTRRSSVNCETGSAQRHLTAVIQDTGNERIDVTAVICGPDYSAGESAVRRMLTSLQVTR